MSWFKEISLSSIRTSGMAVDLREEFADIYITDEAATGGTVNGIGSRNEPARYDPNVTRKVHKYSSIGVNH